MDIVTIKKHLDSLCSTYDGRFISSDPIEFVHRYSRAEDKEVVALICSSLAYGNVKMIQRNLDRLLRELGPTPAEFIHKFEPQRQEPLFSGFVHRFNKQKDIILLLYYIRQMLAESGSIGEFFKKGHIAGSPNIKPALTSFVRRTLALDCTPVYPSNKLPADAGVQFFFPSPENGSACKRLNLFLRWMVRRRDGIDFGLWQFISPAQLIIPLDTHIARISRLIGLTQRKSEDWTMAAEITNHLRKLDPEDPVKYDFPLSRLGILAQCRKNPSTDNCGMCEIRSLCSAFSQRTLSTSAVGVLS